MIPEAKNLIFSDNIAIFEADDWDGSDLMNRLGGTVKLGDLLDKCPISALSADRIANKIALNADRTLDFGLTIYGGSEAERRRLRRLPIELKKALKAKNLSVRWVTGPKNATLSPAAVAKCGLTTLPNADLCLLLNDGNAYIGRTTDVQNADAWSERDFGRPVRDSLNGMLPPKLARMLVNLGQLPDQGTLLDPFCGSGTILMEAALAYPSVHILGSDLEEKQIKDTEKNVKWLEKSHILSKKDTNRIQAFVCDVRHIGTELQKKSVDVVVTEGWLGPPLKGSETKQVLQKNAQQITELWRTALDALAPICKSGARLVIVLPSFKTRSGHADIDLAQLFSKSTYRQINPLADAGTLNKNLIYSRPNQHVLRRIVVLEKI